jgi:hypothetical protein
VRPPRLPAFVKSCTWLLAHHIVSHGAHHWLGKKTLSSNGEEPCEVTGQTRLSGGEGNLHMPALLGRVIGYWKRVAEVEDAVARGCQIGCEPHAVSHLCGPPAGIAA